MFNHADKKGQVLIISAIFMLLILASSSALVSWSSGISSASHFLDKKTITKEIAKTGIEKALFCLNGDESIAPLCGGFYGQDYTGETNIQFSDGVFTTVITDIDSRTKQIESTGYYPDAQNPKAETTIKTNIQISTTVAHFFFGAQVGEGGLTMDNNSEIIGNIYSNGNITGANGVTVTGDAWGAGTSTTISSITASGDAHAEIIENSDIGGDAYCKTISGSEVEGITYSPYPNAEPIDFPITNEQLDEWKLAAAAGDVINGDFHPDGGDTVELGPAKVIGNLILENNQTLILTGGVYVTGYAEFSNGASVRLDSSYGENSGFIITDGIMSLDNNGAITGAGENSFVMLISLANGGGGYDSAIELKNNARGAVFFAPNGLVFIHNRVQVSEVTAYAIHLNNLAALEYETGLANANFSSGPGGGWIKDAGTWQEIKN